VHEILSNPMDLPSTFWDYMIRKWLNDAPVFPISQVFGFTQFTANQASVSTSESTSSVTYTALTTPGPTLTLLPDGHYLVLVAAFMTDSFGNGAYMSPKVNSGVALDANAAITVSASGTSLIGASTQTLSNGGSNTIASVYRAGVGSTGTFQNRSLIALRYGNL
jgi:hypothetical protein